MLKMEMFKPCYLLTDELNYELRIRGVVTGRDLTQRRKILSRCLEREKGRDLDLSDPEYNYEAETQCINRSIESIRTLVSEFEGPETDSAFKRIKSRLIHVTLRVQRIRIPEEDPAPVRIFKNENYATCLELEADLHERVTIPSNNSDTVTQPQNTSVAPRQSEVVLPLPKNIPIYKWGVTFDGEHKSSSLNSFLERVVELAEARGVSKRELYLSAVDLFAGKGLIWYRSVKSTVQDWDSLVVLLKQEFLPSDYDDQLWEEIKARKQGKTETVSIFIAVMETLFKRLTRPPCEVTKVKHIRQNLLPHYFSQLALLDTPSLSELSKLCKRLEDAYITQNKYRQPQKPYLQMLEPELAYVADTSTVPDVTLPNTPKMGGANDCRALKPNCGDVNKRNQNNFHRKHNPTAGISGSASYSSVLCWNCGGTNHTYAGCRLKRKKFCYRCGLPEVTVASCPKCAGNAR